MKNFLSFFVFFLAFANMNFAQCRRRFVKL